MSRPSTFGFLPCNKSRGMTSRDVVNHVQRRLQLELGISRLKVGHTGTLDPLADGMVIVAVGPATRLTPWMLKVNKRYRGVFQIGVSSTSGDLEEPVTRHSDLPMPGVAQLQSAVDSLHGWIDQIPPAHSAVWVDGQRAYERTRRGETVDMPTRRVWVEQIELVDYQPPNFVIDVVCGSGTYLRSLGIDLAARCGTVAVMTSLTRTAIGTLRLEDAAPTEDYQTPPLRLLDEHQKARLASPSGTRLLDQLREPAQMLGHLSQMQLTSDEVSRVRNGLCVDRNPLPVSMAREKSESMRSESVVGTPDNPFHGDNLDDVYAKESLGDAAAMDPQGRLVAIMREKRGSWCPYRVFPGPI